MKKYFLFLSVIALISLSFSSTNAQSRARISTQKTQTKVKTKAELQKELKAFSKAYQNKTAKTSKTAVTKNQSSKITKPTQSKHQKVKTNKMQIKDNLNACIDGCLDQIAGKGYGNSAAICADLCDCILNAGGLDCANKTVQKVKK